MRVPRTIRAPAPIRTNTICWVMAGHTPRPAGTGLLARRGKRRRTTPGKNAERKRRSGRVAAEHRVGGLDDVGVADRVVVDDQRALAAAEPVVAVAAHRDDEHGA